MADFKLRAILNFLDKSKPGVSSAKKGLGGLDKTIKDAKQSLTGLAVIAAGKAAYELAQLGAQSIRTRNAFNAISGSADEASSRLEAMQRATRGAMSEQAMMASANRLMQMGLADNATELEKVSEMATKLGAAMGKKAGPALEEFALLLANQSIPRLDTFGISAGKVRARILELQKATPGLTRELAFMQATCEEGEKAMARLGDTVDDELLAFERIEASVENLKVAFGEELAPAVAEVVTTMELLLTWNDRIKEATLSHADEVARTTQSYEEYSRELLRAADAAGLAVDAEGNLVKVIQQGDLSKRTPEIAKLVEQQYLVSHSAYEAANAEVEFQDKLLDIRGPVADTAESLGELATSAGKVAKSFGEMVFDNETLWNMALAAGADIDVLEELAVKLGIATEAEIANTLEGYRLVESLGETGVVIDDVIGGWHGLATAEIVAREEAGHAQRGFEELQTGMIETEGVTRDLSGGIRDTEGALGGVEDAARKSQQALARIERDIRVTVYYDQRGRSPSGGGATEGYQHGTAFHPGGLAIVGEAGPEPVALPRGSQVYPAYSPQTQSVSNYNRAGNVYHVSINDQLAAALFLEQMRDEQVERAEAFM